MAISFQDVQEKTIPETQLSTFLSNYLTVEQIGNLLHLKDRAATLRYIQPKEMRMVELFYHPVNKQDKSINSTQSKQLNNRYFIPKEVWAQFIIESGWVTLTTRSIIERFTFKIKDKVKHLLVIQTNHTTEMENEDLFRYLSNWRKKSNLPIETRLNTSREYKPIKSNPSYLYSLTNLCNTLSISSPQNVRPLQVCDQEQALWIYKTSLFQADMIVKYRKEYEGLPRSERFKMYFDEAKKESMGGEIDDEAGYELLTSSVHPFNLLSEETSILTNANADPNIRHMLLNNALTLHNELKSLSLRHKNIIPGIRYTREQNEEFLKDYLYVFDLIHSHKIKIPEGVHPGYHPEIFDILATVTYQLLEIIGGRDARLGDADS